MATATLMRDEERGPVLVETAGGYAGTRHYEIDSNNPASMLTATGLPAVGASWDADSGGYPLTAISGLLVTRRTTIILGGGSPGHGFVRVDYETPGSPSFGGGGRPDDDEVQTTTKFIEIRASRGQQQIIADVDGNAVPETSRLVITTELLVYTYQSSMTWYTTWSPLKTTLNDSAILVPPPYGLSGNQTIGQYRALMLEPQVRTVRSGLIEVVYVLGLADDGTGWTYTYREEDEDGNATGSPVGNQIYEFETWDTATLWGLS